VALTNAVQNSKRHHTDDHRLFEVAFLSRSSIEVIKEGSKGKAGNKGLTVAMVC